MKISRAIYALAGAARTCTGVGQRHLDLSVEVVKLLPANNTCNGWTAWMPPRTEPAVIMQVVSEGYIPVQNNFIVLMEANSGFTRENIYLICLDEASEREMVIVGLRCVPVFGQREDESLKYVWKLRVKVLSYLLAAGYNVIISDSDALWLKDPKQDFNLPEVRDSNIVASRGSFPNDLKESWGATLCMGFIFFRAGAGMEAVLENMERLVMEMGDDQKAVNYALEGLRIQWDNSTDMRYVYSEGFGRGIIDDLDERGINVTLLPHSKYTRKCNIAPIGPNTAVAHCRSKKSGSSKIEWMKREKLWKIDDMIISTSMGQQVWTHEVNTSSEVYGGSDPASLDVPSGGN